MKTIKDIIGELEKVLYSKCGNLEITHGELADGETAPLKDFLIQAMKESAKAVMCDIESDEFDGFGGIDADGVATWYDDKQQELYRNFFLDE